MAGKNSIPKGWMNFTNLGSQLCGTPFVPFKVPLKRAIASKVPERSRFTQEDLLEQLPRLKLIINLTNAHSGRYYKYDDFEEQGVKVFQIMCEGHGVLPKSRQLQSFYDAVDDFLRGGEGSDGIIGVHCTHGLNRTGYFICKYLIEKMNMAPDAAIELFEAARGHNIEREQYTSDLRASCAWKDDGRSSSSSIGRRGGRSGDVSGRSSRTSISYDDGPAQSKSREYDVAGSRSRPWYTSGTPREARDSRETRVHSVANWRDPESRSNARFAPPRQTSRWDTKDDTNDRNRGWNYDKSARYERNEESYSEDKRQNSGFPAKSPYGRDQPPRRY